MYWTENVDSIAKELGKSKSWIYKAAERGDIPYLPIGGSLRFNKEEVWDYLSKRRPKRRGRPTKGGKDVAN